MKDTADELTVEFVLPPEQAEQATSEPSKTCDCGSKRFALANEMTADSAKGIPASRMFECLDCGSYRLG